MNNSINSGKYEEIIKSIKTQVDTYNNYLSGNEVDDYDLLEDIKCK